MNLWGSHRVTQHVSEEIVMTSWISPSYTPWACYRSEALPRHLTLTVNLFQPWRWSEMETQIWGEVVTTQDQQWQSCWVEQIWRTLGLCLRPTPTPANPGLWRRLTVLRILHKYVIFPFLCSLLLSYWRGFHGWTEMTKLFLFFILNSGRNLVLG